MESTPPGRKIGLRHCTLTCPGHPATARSPGSSLRRDCGTSWNVLAQSPSDHSSGPDVPGARRPHSVPVSRGEGNSMIRDTDYRAVTEPDSGDADHLDVDSGRNSMHAISIIMHQPRHTHYYHTFRFGIFFIRKRTSRLLSYCSLEETHTMTHTSHRMQ